MGKFWASAWFGVAILNTWMGWRWWNRESKYHYKHASTTTADEFYEAFDRCQKDYPHLSIRQFTWKHYDQYRSK